MQRWSTWGRGGKAIVLATCVAVASLPLDWADIGPLSSNGFRQDGYLFLGFFLYPALQVLRARPLNRAFAVLCALGAVGAGVGFIGSRQVELFGTHINGAGTGVHVFLVAACVLVYGAAVYRPVPLPGSGGDAAAD